MKRIATLLLSALLGLSFAASAQEATIRKNLSERLPTLPRIDEISKTPMPGIFEVRINQTDIFYTDAEGNYLIQGSMFDTRQRIDLTEERINKLTALSFKDLPLKDAFTLVRGKGTRTIAVFEDPNCGFCKRFERDLMKVDDITVHVFLYPILSADSTEKSRNIWCAKDKGKAYIDWMVNNVTPPAASCDAAALERNVAFGRKARITGTPTIIFADGSRVPGALSPEQLEARLKQTATK